MTNIKQVPKTSALAPTSKPKPVNPIINLFRSDAIKQKISQALPKHLKADRMINVLMTALNTNPKLLQCSRDSLLNAAMQLSQLGLEPNSPLGHAYLIPYNTKNGMQLQLQIGYMGYIELAARSGIRVTARVRRENEPFTVKFGLNDVLEHEYKGDSDSPVTHVYCVAKWGDGFYHFDVMTRSEVEKVRARSHSANDGPWVTDWEAMALKTVIKRARKFWPLSPEKQDNELAREIDEQEEGTAKAQPRLNLAGLDSAEAELVEEAAEEVPAHDPETGVVDADPAEVFFMQLAACNSIPELDAVRQRLNEAAQAGQLGDKAQDLLKAARSKQEALAKGGA